MPNGSQEHAQSVRVVGFEEAAKDEILRVFLQGRAEIQTQLQAVGLRKLKMAMCAAGGTFLLSAPGFLVWLCWHKDASTVQVVGGLVTIGLLLIAFLGALLVFSKATRFGSE